MIECPYCHEKFYTVGLWYDSEEHNELQCWRKHTFPEKYATITQESIS